MNKWQKQTWDDDKAIFEQRRLSGLLKNTYNGPVIMLNLNALTPLSPDNVMEIFNQTGNMYYNRLDKSNMKIKVITTVSSKDNPDFTGIKDLEASLIAFGYDYLIIVDANITWNWGGLSNIYNWCLSDNAKEYTHFLYTDGFDTMALSDMAEVMNKYTDIDCMLFSTEKACFPRSDWAEKHTDGNRWKYLNHGQFISPIPLYLELYNGVFDLPITCQEWAMEKYLSGDTRIKLDLLCNIFQSIAFKSDDEFSISDSRIINNIIPSLPIFPHGNGRSPFDWVRELIK